MYTTLCILRNSEQYIASRKILEEQNGSQKINPSRQYYSARENHEKLSSSSASVQRSAIL
jgi:hypothetical protein